MGKYDNLREKTVVWVPGDRDVEGQHLFTFDGKKIYNFFRDYPHNLTGEEKEIFDKTFPWWANHFKGRGAT